MNINTLRMKKILTSIVASTLLAAPFANISAQTTLRSADKELIRKEVVPTVIKQIKEQAGIDILGWASPQVANASVSGFPVFENSSLLRSGESNTITLRPDSILVSTEYMGSAATFLGDKIKITFANYKAQTIDIPDAFTMNADIPEQIIISSPKTGNIGKIDFNVTKLRSTIYNLDVTLTVLDKKTELITLNIATTDAGYGAILTLKEGLKELITSMDDSVELPDAYQLEMDLVDKAGCYPFHLYAQEDGITVPIGDATVQLNPEEDADFEVDSVQVTGYAHGVANQWTSLKMVYEDSDDDNQAITRVFKYDNNSSFTQPEFSRQTVITTNVEEAAGIRSYSPKVTTKALPGDGIFTMAVSPKISTKGLIKSVVSTMVFDKALSRVTFDVQQTSEESLTPTTLTDVFQGRVDLGVAGTDLVAWINLDTYENNELSETDQIKVTMDMIKKQTAVVEFLDEDKAVATAYYSTNLAGVLTANEQVTADEWSIIPSKEYIRVQHIDRADYQIVSMLGSVEAAGTIAGDAQISTASLPKGMYIFVVKADGKQKAVKFIH